MLTHHTDKYEVYMFTELFCPNIIIWDGDRWYSASFSIPEYGDNRKSAIDNLTDLIFNGLQDADDIEEKAEDIEEDIKCRIEHIHKSIESWKKIGYYELGAFNTGGKRLEIGIGGMIPGRYGFVIFSDVIYASVGLFPSDDYIGDEYVFADEQERIPVRETTFTLKDIFTMMYREIDHLEELLQWFTNISHADVLK